MDGKLILDRISHNEDNYDGHSGGVGRTVPTSRRFVCSQTVTYFSVQDRVNIVIRVIHSSGDVDKG